MKIEAIERMIDALTASQRNALLNILQARIDMQDGTGTQYDLAKAVVSVQPQDVGAIKEIILAIRAVEK